MDTGKVIADFLALLDSAQKRYAAAMVEEQDANAETQDIDGDYRSVPYWCSGRIEHDNGDYCFTGAKNMPLKGAKARIRG